MSDAPAETNTATLRVKAGPLAGPLLTRVVAMMLARAQCPVDRLDDAMVICDALAAHAPAHAQDGRLQFTVLTRPGGMELRVGALAADGAHRVAHAATVPGIGNVLQSIADNVRVESAADTDNDQLVLELGFGTATAFEQSPAGAPSGPLSARQSSGARAADQVPADQGLVEP